MIALGVRIGKHPKYGRADLVAEHRELGTVVVEVEGSSSRQKEQAMYSAIGQLVLQMKDNSEGLVYALAVPDAPAWRKQIEKIPLFAFARLSLRAYLIASDSVSEYPSADDVTDRVILDGEMPIVFPAEDEEQLVELIKSFHKNASGER